MSTPVHLSKIAPAIEPIYLGYVFPFTQRLRVNSCSKSLIARLRGCKFRQHISKTGGHAYNVNLQMKKKDLAYGEIQTTFWWDEILQSEQSSTELSGPGLELILFT